ncbi:hypothetical protein [Pseudarthrobacter sp. ATCC 49987]|nr:hypothetical protein [Pseudarthrobacter sp. ATCC 49987]
MTVTHKGGTFDRWQLELPGGARMWFYVNGQSVCLVNVHTNHPNATR